jgi:hypothetical protein
MAAGLIDAWDWDRIPLEVDQVLDIWRQMLCSRHPWCAMPQDDASGSMRIVVSELLNEAMEPNDGRRDVRLSNALRDHSEFRRDQGFGDRVIVDEIAALKAALGTALRECIASPVLAVDFATVLSAELDAIRATARASA